MDSEFSTPALSQQHSPLLAGLQLASQQAALAHDAAAAPFAFGHARLDIATPTTAVDINSAHFAYLKDAFPARPFSPSTVDFASMNIASGNQTPLPATPLSAQPQSLQTDAAAATASESASTTTPSPGAAAEPNAEKPEFSYASLIAQSLEDAPMQRRTLNGIYEWIQENFPYYRTRQNWQNSIRHNLSLNKGFMKVKRDEAHPGKGSFWTFTPGYESFLNSGHFKPVRSRSGRAALAAAAAMAAAKASAEAASDANTDEEDDNDMDGDDDCESTANNSDKSATEDAEMLAAGATTPKKADKRAPRIVKASKSLKRSLSMPPKEHRAPLAQPSLSASGPTVSLPSADSMAPPSPSPLAHCETIPIGSRNSVKKMRVSSSQSHSGVSGAIPPSALNIAAMPHPHVGFPISPAFLASPAPMSAAPMSVVSSAAHTPLHPSAQFQFQMQSACSMPMPMSAMDLASVPATSAPYLGAFVGHFNEATAAMDSPVIFGDAIDGIGSSASSINGDALYVSRRTSNLPSRISWHGPESMTQAFATLQQQQQQQHQQQSLSLSHLGSQSQHQFAQQRFASSLGVSMGADIPDITLPMLGEASSMAAVHGEGAISASPADWAMFAGISGSVPVSDAAAAMHVSGMHHVNAIGVLDAGAAHEASHMQMAAGSNHGHSHSQSSIGGHPQARLHGISAMDAAAVSAGVMAAGGDSGNSQGILAFYDEMLRDPSSLMSVLGQDLSGWQCPTKTNTIDPAALCAVDPESNNSML
ncbi:Forkhead box protein I2 [Coemansia sp. Benny D115]|nr:Forkhead box protein I2 [Coemansia sp. Benny D115]